MRRLPTWCFPKLAVSDCQHISKADHQPPHLEGPLEQDKPAPSLRILPDDHQGSTHPELQRDGLDGLPGSGTALLISSHRPVAIEILRSTDCALHHGVKSVLFSMVNFQQKPSYLLTVMRVFNEGVSQWHDIIVELGVTELFCSPFQDLLLLRWTLGCACRGQEVQLLFCLH